MSERDPPHWGWGGACKQWDGAGTGGPVPAVACPARWRARAAGAQVDVLHRKPLSRCPCGTFRVCVCLCVRLSPVMSGVFFQARPFLGCTSHVACVGQLSFAVGGGQWVARPVPWRKVCPTPPLPPGCRGGDLLVFAPDPTSPGGVTRNG